MIEARLCILREHRTIQSWKKIGKLVFDFKFFLSTEGQATSPIK